MALTTSQQSGVTINEVHEFLAAALGAESDLNGAGGPDLFVERYNSSSSPAKLDGWELWETSVLKHTFQAGDTIGAGSRFTLVDDAGGPDNPIVNVTGDADYFDYNIDLYGCERLIPEMHSIRISARRQLPHPLRDRFGIPCFHAQVEQDFDAMMAHLKST